MNQPVKLDALKQSALAPREASMPAVKAGFFDLQSFELIQRVAKGFASSTLVPKEYQNNISNCMIALNLAQRIGGDPLMVMQSLVIVHGRPTWSAQYLIATANMCGRFSAIRFEFFGERNTDSWGCRAWAVERDTGEKLVGSDVTIEIAKKEGWYGKNGSKWQSIPQQMLMYRAGSWWVRAYAPELSMGLTTAEEAVDSFDAFRDEDGTYSVSVESLRKGAGEQIPDSVDLNTGEVMPPVAACGVIDNDDDQLRELEQAGRQPQPSNGPTYDDAMRFVHSGEHDVALEIARSLPEGERKAVERAIYSANAKAQPARQQRNRGDLNLD